MIKYVETHAEAFGRANTLYGTTADEWERIMAQYVALIAAREVMPDGYDKVPAYPEYAVNKSGTVIAVSDLTVICPSRDDRLGFVVTIANKFIPVSVLVANTFLPDIDTRVIKFKDGDVYNPSSYNLCDTECTSSIVSRIDIVEYLQDGLASALKRGLVDEVFMSSKPISDIRSGHLVLCQDEKDIVIRPVTSALDVIVQEEEQVTIETADGKFHTSKTHPVPVSKNGDTKLEWVPAGDVRKDDLLFVSDEFDSELTMVTAITDEKKDIHFRDLTVKDTHNYFIRGEGGVAHLIHNTRKGAVAVYVEPWHIDVKHFLDSRKTATEARLAAHDLFPALWMNDLFFDRVDADADWTLFDPYNCPDLHSLYGDEFNKRYEQYERDLSIPRETIKAKSLLKEILVLYFETGSPFLLMKDEVNRRHQCENIGIIRSSNLCVEIMNATDPGKLMTVIEFEDGTELTLPADSELTTDAGINKRPSRLNHFDTIEGKRVSFIANKVVGKKTSVCNLMSVNLGKLKEISDLEEMAKIMVRATDNVIDVNFYPIGSAKHTNVQNRSIGIGAMGEHHFLAKRGIMYGSQEHFEIIDELYEAMSFYVIKASMELAREKGSYPEFEGSNWSKGILPIDTANKAAEELTTREYTMDWDWLREEVKKGMRNGYLLAIAPTSTISVHTSTTSSVEPVYKRSYIEDNMSVLTKVIAPELSAATWNYYVGAYDLDQNLLVTAAAVRQKWLDQSQSLTIFVKEGSMTGGSVYKLYNRGRKLGVKSFYYLRTESPETIEQETKTAAIECENCQ